MKPIAILASLLLCAGSLLADLVITTDGSRLTGKITLIDEGVIHLKTPFAGTIKIKQSQVASFETDEPVIVRLASGATLEGPVQRGTGDTLRVIAPDGTLETTVERVTASWQPDQQDPQVVRREAEIKSQQRRWRYEAAFDVLGRSGNSRELGVGASFSATLRGPNDSLRFFGQYENRTRNGARTADRILGGVDFENFFGETMGWYARTQAETDRIRNFDFRSNSAAGLSYRVINTEKQSLIFRSGIGYEYTSFTTARSNESEGTLDFGLAHRLRINDSYLMNNRITVVPTLEDFGDYRVVHETSIEFPVGNSDFWSVRAGIQNEYESRPAATKNLDTTYFTRMVLRWD